MNLMGKELDMSFTLGEEYRNERLSSCKMGESLQGKSVCRKGAFSIKIHLWSRSLHKRNESTEKRVGKFVSNGEPHTSS